MTHPDVRLTPVPFAAMSTSRQAWESVGGALVTGVVAGLLLGVTWWAYALAVLVALVGGIPAGSQHRTLVGAFARGFVGGTVWAMGVLAGAATSPRSPTVALPDPQLLYLAFGIVPACVVANLSWYVAHRRRSGS